METRWGHNQCDHNLQAIAAFIAAVAEAAFVFLIFRGIGLEISAR
jgi:hypothetical protein